MISLLRMTGILGLASLAYAQSMSRAGGLPVELGSEVCAGEWHAAPLCPLRKWSSPHSAARISRRLVRVSPGYAAAGEQVSSGGCGPRGVGRSAPAESGYDAGDLAEDIYQLIRYLGLEHVYVFGHDIGGIVAYAFARRYPQSAPGVRFSTQPFPVSIAGGISWSSGVLARTVSPDRSAREARERTTSRVLQVLPEPVQRHRCGPLCARIAQSR
jgi:hypothetical protein